MMAIFLKWLVHAIHSLVTSNQAHGINYLYLFLPLVGLILTSLIIRYFFKGDIGKGIGGVLYEIAQKSGFVRRSKMYSHVITSGITVGFGGSAGLESPIAVTGAAIGSYLSRLFRLMYKDRILLLAAGSAAGIASAFNAPITGVVFAAEVLLSGISTFEFIPIIIAAICGTLCSNIFLSQDVLFHFKLQESFNYMNVPFYLVLGIMTGFFSLYYIRMSNKIEHAFKSFRENWWLRAMVAGLLLAFCFMLFPSLFGEGYESIRLLANNEPEKLIEHSVFQDIIANEWYLLIFVAIVAFFKVLATSITLSGGGNGGNFAPTLFVGAYLGFFVSKLINLSHIAKVPESNFTLVGMCGVLSGVMLAPLTGVFLIAEITGGYELIVPLMIVAITSYIIVRYFERYSLDTKKLAMSGKIYIGDKDKNILGSIKVKDVIEKDIKKIDPEVTLRSLVEVVKRTKRNIIVAVDQHDTLIGIIELSEIREILFNENKYDSVVVKDLIKYPKNIVDYNDSMILVMEKFESCHCWNLPVIHNNKYVGFISRSNVLQFYRSELSRQAGLP